MIQPILETPSTVRSGMMATEDPAAATPLPTLKGDNSRFCKSAAAAVNVQWETTTQVSMNFGIIRLWTLGHDNDAERGGMPC